MQNCRFHCVRVSEGDVCGWYLVSEMLAPETVNTYYIKLEDLINLQVVC